MEAKVVDIIKIPDSSDKEKIESFRLDARQLLDTHCAFIPKEASGTKLCRAIGNTAAGRIVAMRRIAFRSDLVACTRNLKIVPHAN